MKFFKCLFSIIPILLIISLILFYHLEKLNQITFHFNNYNLVYDKRYVDLYINGQILEQDKQVNSNITSIKFVLKKYSNTTIDVSLFDFHRVNSNAFTVIFNGEHMADYFRDNTSCNVEFSNLRTLYFPCPEKIQEYKQSVIDQPKYGFTFYDIIDQSDYVHRIAEIPIFDKKFSQISVAFYEIDEFINYKSEIFSIIDKLLNMKQDTKIHL
jgi:hypothetical protein